MSESKTAPKGDDKGQKRSWAEKIFGWKKSTPTTSTGKEGVNTGLFVLADGFGKLMREKTYTDLPTTEKTRLRQPVEQALGTKDEGKTKIAIETFKVEVGKAHTAYVKSLNDRIEADQVKATALADRGSPGAAKVATLLATAKQSAKDGKIPDAAAQLDDVEAAIMNDVDAHLGLAQGRINSLSDWRSPEAGGLDNRIKAIASKSTLATFETTWRDYDTLMRDVVAAATVPTQERQSRSLAELRKGIVTALAGVPDTPPQTTTPPPTLPTPPTPPTGGGTGGTKPLPTPPLRRGLQPPPPPPKISKETLQQRFDVWDKALTAANKETDPAKKTTALDTLDNDATKLFADILKAKGGDTKAEREAVFKDALEARFGFVVETGGHPFTNLDKMYEVLKMVPPEDVTQSKLAKLVYRTPGEDGAAYGGAVIYMGDYGDAKGDWNYQNPDGTPAPVNGYGISALHELGHSIDDRNGIMSSNQGKSGCGGWERESVDSITDVFFRNFSTGPGKNSKVPEDIVRSLITATLNGGVPSKPDTIADTDWAPVKVALDSVDGIRDANGKWPWNNPTVIGGRAYHESYAGRGEWWSYDPGARNGTTVRNYQWRSPAEWFAELYAYTHFKKQKPPSGIDSGVAVFMWK